MTEKNLTQLYPLPVREFPLKSAYLAHELRRHAASSGAPFVYGNFVTSVDGRIAVVRPDGEGLKVPEATANPRDWRLFHELAAQADILISTGRYLREWAEGRAQEIFKVDDARFADLRAWREDQGLKPQPDIAVVSFTLEFPMPEVLTAGERDVIVFTAAAADPDRIRAIEAQGVPVLIAGEESVQGDRMIERLAERGYQTIYSAAGPKVVHLLLEARVLNRLYITYVNRLLGSKVYASMVEGPSLEPPADLHLNTLYFDAGGLDGIGQLFVSYDCV